MRLHFSSIWPKLACLYFVSFVIILVYLTYTATVNLPTLPEKNSIYWWHDHGSVGRYVSHHTCTETDVVCDACCYCYTAASHILGDFGELSQAKLAERQCEKRLPKAIIIGAMKSGTYALRTFLSYHPDIAMAFDEPWFWNKEDQLKKGLERYREMMHYSSPGQLTMEKTPDYYHADGVPELIRKNLTDVKLIMIMRDPVKRAISHYNFDRLRAEDTNPFPASFEEAVMLTDSTGRYVNEQSPYILHSAYAIYVQKWLRYFPVEQFLAIDGDAFLRDPLPQLLRIERFLNIQSYFSQDAFFRNRTSGFWCLKKPISTCVPQSQPHPPHPGVRDSILADLYRYFRPYNAQLAKLLTDSSFEWYSN